MKARKMTEELAEKANLFARSADCGKTMSTRKRTSSNAGVTGAELAKRPR